MGGKIEDYRKRLFATYIDRMFQRRMKLHRNWIDRILRRQRKKQQYTREETQRWLIWLAQKMTDKAQTIFLIERLQPNWLSSKRQQICYRIGSGCLSGLIFVMISILSSGLIYKLTNGKISGLGNVLIYGLIYGLWISFLGDIQLVETLKWSWQKARNSLKVGSILGFIFFLIYVLTKSLITNGVIVGVTDMLLYGLNYGLLGGLIGCLIGGFRGAEIHQSEKVNQGIFRSAQNAVISAISLIFIFALIVGSLGLILIPALSLSIGLASGIVFGPIAGLVLGGNATIRHFALRLFIYRKRYAPWNYARFLDYATERLFLQKVGGGYIFMHRMLLEHFAEMSIEQEKR